MTHPLSLRAVPAALAEPSRAQQMTSSLVTERPRAGATLREW
ncbi:hypothetical protein ABZY03_22660 [Streptomyces klenkii]